MKRISLWLGLTLLLTSAPVTHAEQSGLKEAGSITVMSATYAVYNEPLGSLRVANQPAYLTLSASGTQQFNQTLRLMVEQQGDSGWQYAVSLNDFTIRHKVQEGTMQARIPAEYASYHVSELIAEEEAGGVTTGTGVFSSGSPQIVMQAAEGSGRGSYSAELLLQVDLPALIEVSEVNNTDRVFPGEQVGLLAGEYRASLTFTLVNGL
ncbi:hypothetical protein C162_18944 [Paenibacillus sp. FSL R7-269]|uniref:hypothetical protein n=1 Tax=Paenibacillus sp. FSL R7-269 TaxID=1226755 RepID=UPI0003E1DD61|nr:hypothetical protein [Paenibacillus sp. FSL R7-269]ETT46873.1 hypothetical protein C162_18944 [Paenibacillus sp. FSL R7-269]